MTKTQFSRWIKFSMAMVRRTSLANTSRRKHKMCQEIKSFFREIQRNYALKNILDWDGNYINGRESICVCDIAEESLEHYKKWDEKTEWYYERKFADGISAAIRAGFDICVRQSGGVLGFTIKDIKAMYRGNVPLWLKRKFIKFAEIKDAEHILL